MSQTTGYQGGVKNRRKRALSRLQEDRTYYLAQVSAGTAGASDAERQIIRIDKEIETLKSRI